MNFEIMINECYGGLKFSNLALDQYYTIKYAADPQYLYAVNNEIDREDVLMINICKNMGKSANARGSNIVIKSIPSIYNNYYSINDEGGWETVIIKYKKYKLDAIQNIIELSIDTDEQVNRIKNILQIKNDLV